jgi:hypothetical protein
MQKPNPDAIPKGRSATSLIQGVFMREFGLGRSFWIGHFDAIFSDLLDSWYQYERSPVSPLAILPGKSKKILNAFGRQLEQREDGDQCASHASHKRN